MMVALHGVFKPLTNVVKYVTHGVCLSCFLCGFACDFPNSYF